METIKAETNGQELSRPKNMECNCCGSGARARQWWNRDTGYSICVRCGDEQSKKYGAEEVERCNGKRGIHWDIKD